MGHFELAAAYFNKVLSSVPWWFLISYKRMAFNQAHHHLSELFDHPDYDVACTLGPMSWWSRFYALHEQEGAVYYHFLSPPFPS